MNSQEFLRFVNKKAFFFRYRLRNSFHFEFLCFIKILCCFQYNKPNNVCTYISNFHEKIKVIL